MIPITKNREPLSKKETIEATKVLVKDVESFQPLKKSLTDPPISGKEYSLFSFIPATNAKPDEEGRYGYAKIRGSGTKDEVNDIAINLVKHHDSFLNIYHIKTGVFFPILEPEKIKQYCAETAIVKKDISKKSDFEISIYKNQVLEGKEKEEKEIITRYNSILTTPISDYVDKRKRFVELAENHKMLKNNLDDLNKAMEILKAEIIKEGTEENLESYIKIIDEMVEDLELEDDKKEACIKTWTNLDFF